MCVDVPELLQIDRRPSLGRYARASRKLHAGKLFIDELPFVIGPKPDVPPVCLGCYIPLDGSGEGPRCPRCNWPLCENCQQTIDEGHHADECALFVENKVKFQNFPLSDAPCLQLDCITPLRMLLKKEQDSDRWEKEIMHMEYHPKERLNTPAYLADQVNVVGYLHGPCKLKQRFSGELIQQVLGILEVNSFEARTTTDQRVRCIYSRASILAHSCKPNTMHSILPSDDFRIQVRTTVDINEGDIFYATYAFTMTGTQNRQQHVKMGKYFTCNCERCLDPTELGTNFSSLICQSCKEGLITAIIPVDETSKWKCSKCEFVTTDECIRKSISAIESEIDKLQEGPENIEACENLIIKYSKVLHQNHYLQVKIKDTLITMYGIRLLSRDDFQSVTVNILERRLKLTRSVLAVLDVIQPGLNRARAMLFYEMYTSLIALIKINWNSLPNRDEQIAEASGYFSECVKVFEWEDKSSVEYTLLKICHQLSQNVNMMLMSEGMCEMGLLDF